MANIIGPETYAGWRTSELGCLTEQIEDELLFALMGDVAGRRVLDVGCVVPALFTPAMYQA